MLTYGLALRQKNDPLHKIEVEAIIRKIKKPRLEFRARIDQLRRIREIDPKQYTIQKADLPYFCCSLFNPSFRKKDNFAAARGFVLDLDKFTEAEMNKGEVAARLKKDPNLRFMFTSPSGDGLKLLFLFKEQCKDAGKYSSFYEAFSLAFANKYKIKDVIDWKTKDVARATFFSADEEAWDNPDAEAIDINEYIDDNVGLDFAIIEKEFAKVAKEQRLTIEKTEQHPLGMDVLAQIKQKLRPNYKPKKEKEIIIPEALTDAMPLILDTLSSNGIELVKTTSINYGKQLKVSVSPYWAEVNVYSGKKGFTIVRSSKTGSNTELAELTFQLLDKLFNG